MKRKFFSKKIFLSFLITFFVAADFWPAGVFVRAQDAEDVRDEINDVNKDIEKEEKKLNQYNSNLVDTQKEINVTAGIINRTEQEISRKVAEIDNLNQRIALNKKILEGYILEMSFDSGDDPTVKFAAAGNLLNEFSGNFDSMISVKEKVLAIMDEIRQDKKDLGEAKEELAAKKEEHEDILAGKYDEKNQISGQIAESKATIAELQAKLSKLRSVLSSFLGESYTMDDVINAVKFADKKTGVRKEFLFAVLDKETDLGRYTGGCTYKKSKMGSVNSDYFKEICDELGYDYQKMKVSCPLSYGIGGAMGVAQFMPSTWMGYKDAIAAKTGHDPADPWNLEDGIMGMALYLKNKGGDSKSGEYRAAAMYYCGGNWKRTVCKNYADTVISWSKGYDDYF